MDEVRPRTRVTVQLRELRFDAGSPALDLLATVGRRPTVGIERLGDVARLRAWTDGVGFPLDDGELTAASLAELYRLREAIFTVVTNVMAEEPVDSSAVSVVNACAATEPGPPRLVLSAGGHLEERPLRWSLPELKAALARDAIAILADPARRGRLRTCDSPLCRMIFLDAPGGRPRRWCSMRRCGNSTKAAAFRQRSEEGTRSG